MIAKLINSELYSMNGELTPFHESKGYKKYADDHFQLQEDGTRYSYYLEDGTPDLEKIMEEDTKNLLQSIESSIQAMIDKEAQSRGYDDIVSACSYAGYLNEFQDEAISLGTWRSAVWAKAYELQASMTEVPTVEEVLSQLPTYTEAV